MIPAGRKIRIGTRGSKLALWQAEHVAARLAKLGAETSIEIIDTIGDRDKVTEFGALGAKGVFVKEIESALIDGRIDLAVHSLKDLPTALPDGLVLGAVLKRASPFDALVSRDRLKLNELPPGATLGTGSLRRAAQVLVLRPDLKIVPLRGNVPTRIKKIRDGQAAWSTKKASPRGTLGSSSRPSIASGRRIRHARLPARTRTCDATWWTSAWSPVGRGASSYAVARENSITAGASYGPRIPASRTPGGSPSSSDRPIWS